jgi:hypothetical protein
MPRLIQMTKKRIPRSKLLMASAACENLLCLGRGSWELMIVLRMPLEFIIRPHDRVACWTFDLIFLWIFLAVGEKISRTLAHVFLESTRATELFTAPITNTITGIPLGCFWTEKVSRTFAHMVVKRPRATELFTTSTTNSITGIPLWHCCMRLALEYFMTGTGSPFVVPA